MCEERRSQMRPGHVKLVRDEEGRTGEENGSGEGWEWGGEGLAGWLWRASSRKRCDGRKTRQRRPSSQAGASRFAGPPDGSGVGKAALGTGGTRGTRASQGHPAVTLL